MGLDEIGCSLRATLLVPSSIFANYDLTLLQATGR